MKKGLILVASLLLLSFSASAAVKIELGGEVNVVFTYEDPNAGFVGLVGDFQGWNLDGAIPMEKDENGVWSVTVPAKVTDTMKYKFNVDGEWTEDASAPSAMDDGFGGLNGLVIVADLVGGGDEGAAQKKLNFGNYTEVSVDTAWLTKDVAEGTEDGFDLDSVDLMLKSYWKLDGYVLPSIKIFTELAVIDTGSITYYKANTDSTDDPFTTPEEGLESTLDAFFNPYTAFGGQRPYMGHFKTTFETPWVNIFQAYNYGKGTLREADYIYTTVSETDSGDGIVELTNPESYDFGGVEVDWMIAPNKRDGNYGWYTWVDVAVAGTTNSLQWSSKTEQDDSIYMYWKEFTNMINLASTGTFGDLTYIFEGFMNAGNTDAITDAEIVDLMAAALNLNYQTDMFGVEFEARYGGDSVNTLFGNDDDLSKGNLYFELNPQATIGDLNVGLDSNVTLDNYSSDNDTEPGIETYLKPYVGYDLQYILPFALNVDLYSKMSLDVIAEATDADQPMGIALDEVAFKLAFGEVNSMIEGIDVYGAYTIDNGDWVAADEAFAANGADISSIVKVSFPAQLAAYAGVNYRMQGADQEDADYEKESALGATLAVDKKLEAEAFDAWKNPRVYAMFDYNFAPWDGGKPTLEMDDFRADDLGAGSGKAVLRFGTIWDF